MAVVRELKHTSHKHLSSQIISQKNCRIFLHLKKNFHTRKIWRGDLFKVITEKCTFEGELWAMQRNVWNQFLLNNFHFSPCLQCVPFVPLKRLDFLLSSPQWTDCIFSSNPCGFILHLSLHWTAASKVEAQINNCSIHAYICFANPMKEN